MGKYLLSACKNLVHSKSLLSAANSILPDIESSHIVDRLAMFAVLHRGQGGQEKVYYVYMHHVAGLRRRKQSPL